LIDLWETLKKIQIPDEKIDRKMSNHIKSAIRNNQQITLFIPTVGEIKERHLIPGAYSSNDLENIEFLQSFNGEFIKVPKDRESIADSLIVLSDIFCSNGIIHIIKDN
jgi:hypothetical protein